MEKVSPFVRMEDTKSESLTKVSYELQDNGSGTDISEIIAGRSNLNGQAHSNLRPSLTTHLSNTDSKISNVSNGNDSEIQDSNAQEVENKQIQNTENSENIETSEITETTQTPEVTAETLRTFDFSHGKGSIDNEIKDSDRENITHLTLPSELVDFTDKFINDLKAPVHSSPITVKQLVLMFHNFYTIAHTKAAAYIRRNSLHKNFELPLETYEEVKERRKKRKLNQLKIQHFEDLMEAKVCQTLFDRLFNVYYENDAKQDKFIYNRIIAASEVSNLYVHLGIRKSSLSHPSKAIVYLKELHTKNTPKLMIEWLSRAQKEIVNVIASDDSISIRSKKSQKSQKSQKSPDPIHNSSEEPLNDINDDGHNIKSDSSNIIKAEDKNSSDDSLVSADLLLPILISSIIDARNTNIYSCLKFMSRFRNPKRMEGIEDYCLTNLEAALEFLKTMDINQFRIEDGLDPIENLDDISSITIEPSCFNEMNKNTLLSAEKDNDSSKHNSRFPFLTNSSNNISDQGIRNLGNNIGASFGNSYKYLFGRMSSEKKSSENLESLSNTKKTSPSSSQGSTGVNDDKSDLIKTKYTSDDGDDSLQDNNLKNSNINTANNTDSNISIPNSNSSIITEERSFNPLLKMKWSFGRNTSAPNFIPPENEIKKISPPIEKFLNLDCNDITVGEVKLLLNDYKRLSSFISSISGFNT